MIKKNFSTIIIENIKTLIGALIIAILIRSLLFQPFYIPSSSMEPTLLVGDRIFASKYVYGYSRHSFPFSPKLFNGRIPPIFDINGTESECPSEDYAPVKSKHV